MNENERSTAHDFDRDTAPDLSADGWPEKLAKATVRRGRPPVANPKVSTTIRLSRDVIDHFKAGGRGWQTRINTALRESIGKHDGKEVSQMTKTTVHVVPREEGWAVRRSHAERDSSRHGTQEQAIEAGRRTAKRESTELFVHRPDGRIRDRDSYGNDPFPPRDKKH